MKKPMKAPTMSGTIIGKPINKRTIIVIKIMLAIVVVPFLDLELVFVVTFQNRRREINILRCQVLDGGESVLNSGHEKADRNPDECDPNRDL